MSQVWNGADFVDELSTLLGDTSTAFQSKVLGWVNDIIQDISIRHSWPFLREFGQKVLTASAELHDLNLAQPTAPTATIATGGSLTESSVYYVLVTYYEGVSEIESIAGVASGSATATSVNKTINLTSIPVSADPLVTARKIYLKKDSGRYYYYSTISNNTATTSTITAEVSGTIEPPDYKAIRVLSGEPFLQSSQQLTNKPLTQLRSLFQGAWSAGVPEFWAEFKSDKIVLYPPPSTALTCSFYYLKNLGRVYDSSTSSIPLPIVMKPLLKAGVVARGYEYRDRDGQESKQQNYEFLMAATIRVTKTSIGGVRRVRDTQGDSDGREF